MLQLGKIIEAMKVKIAPLRHVITIRNLVVTFPNNRKNTLFGKFIQYHCLTSASVPETSNNRNPCSFAKGTLMYILVKCRGESRLFGILIFKKLSSKHYLIKESQHYFHQN